VSDLVVGVDGTREGWVAAGLQAGEIRFVRVWPRLADLLKEYPAAGVVAVDIPLGLPSGKEPRAADLEARRFLSRGRHASVFPAYPLAVYEADTYEEARKRAVSLTGRGLSAQAFGLAAKIREAAECGADPRVYEVHPEVSFQALAGEPLSYGKKSWNGFMGRLGLLDAAGMRVPPLLPDVGSAASDDVLDAAIAAWSASRALAGEAARLPAAGKDRMPAIWY
jgi:predicted RNase H-like nuclease